MRRNSFITRGVNILVVIVVCTIHLSAQTSSAPNLKFLSWQAFAGLNFGATAPVPVPEGVTEVYAWYPNTNPSVGIMGVHQFRQGKPHAIGFALQAERKSFRATTKLENLKVADAEPISGNQRTDFSGRYLTLPIFYMANLSKDRVQLYAGAYASLLLGSEFNVTLDSDPESLDEGTIVVTPMNDFVRPYDIGLILGANIFFSTNLGLTLRFTSGLTTATKESFRDTGYPLHNLYSFVGLAYRF